MSARRSAASGALARREWPGARAAAREGSNERKRAPAGNISDGEHATRQQKGGVRWSSGGSQMELRILDRSRSRDARALVTRHATAATPRHHRASERLCRRGGITCEQTDGGAHR